MERQYIDKEEYQKILYLLSKQNSKLQTCCNKLSTFEERIIQLEKCFETNNKPPTSCQPINANVPLHQCIAKNITGIIGLKEAVTSQHPVVKWIWIVLVLGGIASTIFFTYNTTNEYLAEPTATKIKLNRSVAFDIPPIAFCPASWMDAEKALSLNMSLDTFKYSLGYIDTWRDMKFQNFTKARLDFLQFMSAYNCSLVDYYKAIALDMPVVYSTKELDNLTNGIKLGDKMSWVIDKYFLTYEICYVVKFKPTDQSLSTATTTAYVKFRDKTNNIANISSSLWLQLTTDLNFLSTQYSPLNLPTLTRNKVLIHAQRMVQLKTSNSLCVRNDDVNENYSASVCTSDCQNQYYKRKIDCLLFRYSSVSNNGHPTEYCNFWDDAFLYNDQFYQLLSSFEHRDVTIACLKRCPPKCDRIIYQATLQWQQPLLDIGSDLWSNQSKMYYSAIHVEHVGQFEGEIMTLIEVSTYRYTELLNNIGGTLGLFVGATMMTFAQVILFFVDYMCTNRGKTN